MKVGAQIGRKRAWGRQGQIFGHRVLFLAPARFQSSEPSALHPNEKAVRSHLETLETVKPVRRYSAASEPLMAQCLTDDAMALLQLGWGLETQVLREVAIQAGPAP